MVFTKEGSAENLAKLNSTAHKYVWDEVNAILTEHQNKGKSVAVIDAPALFSSKIFIGACDFILSVLCDKETRIERITKRDGISREMALAKINSQPSDEFFAENSDYYITNSGTQGEMCEQLLDKGLLSDEFMIVVEHRRGMAPLLDLRFEAFDLRKYGDTEITFVRSAAHYHIYIVGQRIVRHLIRRDFLFFNYRTGRFHCLNV